MNTGNELPEKPKNRKLFDFYFRTREFEADGKIYEKVGVRHAQAIIMGTVGRAYRAIGMDEYAPTYFIGKSVNESSLRSYAFCTKFNEAFHTIFTPYTIYSHIEKMNSGDYGNTSASLAGLLIINSYFIILQRYNRARVENVLRKRYKGEA